MLSFKLHKLRIQNITEPIMTIEMTLKAESNIAGKTWKFSSTHFTFTFLFYVQPMIYLARCQVFSVKNVNTVLLILEYDSLVVRPQLLMRQFYRILPGGVLGNQLLLL